MQENGGGGSVLGNYLKAKRWSCPCERGCGRLRDAGASGDVRGTQGLRVTRELTAEAPLGHASGLGVGGSPRCWHGVQGLCLMGEG